MDSVILGPNPHLPYDILAIELTPYLTVPTFLKYICVNQRLSKLRSDPKIWKIFLKRDFNYSSDGALVPYSRLLYRIFDECETSNIYHHRLDFNSLKLEELLPFFPPEKHYRTSWIHSEKLRIGFYCLANIFVRLDEPIEIEISWPSDRLLLRISITRDNSLSDIFKLILNKNPVEYKPYELIASISEALESIEDGLYCPHQNIYISLSKRLKINLKSLK